MVQKAATAIHPSIVEHEDTAYSHKGSVAINLFDYPLPHGHTTFSNNPSKIGERYFAFAPLFNQKKHFPFCRGSNYN